MKSGRFLQAFFSTSAWLDSTRVFYGDVEGELVPLVNFDFPTLNYLSPSLSNSGEVPKFDFKNGMAMSLNTDPSYPFGLVNGFLAHGKEVKEPFKIEVDRYQKITNLTPYFCSFAKTNRGFYMTGNYTTKAINCTRSDIYLLPVK